MIKPGTKVRVVNTGWVSTVQGYQGDLIKLLYFPGFFTEDELEVVAMPAEQPTVRLGSFVRIRCLPDLCPKVKVVGLRINDFGGVSYSLESFLRPFLASELEVVDEEQKSPSDVIINTINTMEEEIACLKKEADSLRRDLARAKAELGHCQAMFEHYKLFHPVH
jgi:hypothetical protein